MLCCDKYRRAAVFSFRLADSDIPGGLAPGFPSLRVLPVDRLLLPGLRRDESLSGAAAPAYSAKLALPSADFVYGGNFRGLLGGQNPGDCNRQTAAEDTAEAPLPVSGLGGGAAPVDREEWFAVRERNWHRGCFLGEDFAKVVHNHCKVLFLTGNFIDISREIG